MSGGSFEILGGQRLEGEVIPQGAKNEALQILCAVLLTDQRVTIRNIPMIRDVQLLIELLGDMGVEVESVGDHTYTFQARDLDFAYLESATYHRKAARLRGSIMLMGAMLGRFGRASMPRPGGDKIGRRRLDTHFLGFEKLGASFSFDREAGLYRLEASALQGTSILLDEASVTGTANLIMAAVYAKGTTTLYNAACEPYIQQLCRMLVSMGAKIEGIGSNLLHIEGVTSLQGTDHTMLPDMIEIGSFIGLAATTGSAITIKDCRVDQLGLIPDTFRRLGIQIDIQGDDLHIPRQDHYEIESFLDGSILTIADAPWPGFTPDLLSVVIVTATQARGTVLVHQKMFESRLFFVDKLIDMGAKIILCDPHRATIIGLDRKASLRGILMTSPYIRAGVALLIAALSAEGRSIIRNIEQIDRGYERIEERLRALGAQIKRLDGDA
jgi:UDP-N-acetylglucosamine 1-carboxyvinyltransferase